MKKKNFVLLSVVAGILLVMTLLFFFYKHNTDRFLNLFQNYFMYAYSQSPIVSFCIFFVLHAPYHIFLLPGYTLFAIAAGFFMQDVFYTFCMFFVGKLLILSELNLDCSRILLIQVFVQRCRSRNAMQ